MNSPQIGAAVCAAGQAQIAVVVESHPHDAKQIRGVAGKPAIARRAGLSRRRAR